jgi:hypothetical protein
MVHHTTGPAPERHSQSKVYIPQERGYFPPVTPKHGYWLKLSPKYLMDNISYQPIIHRLQHDLLSTKPNRILLAPVAVQVRMIT